MLGTSLRSESGFSKVPKKSSFWISCGDVLLSSEIAFNAPDHLRHMRQLLKQKISENCTVSFGIDEIKYMEVMDNDWTLPDRLPHARACSYFWFSAGGLIVPFSGKNLSTSRILMIFDFIRQSALSGEKVSFGVDDLEFLEPCEFHCNCEQLDLW